MLTNYIKNTLSLPRIIFDAVNQNSDHYNKAKSLNNSSLDSSNDAVEFPQHHNHIHFLNNTLSTIVENPNSSVPFDIILNDITKILKAEAGALFLTTESGNPELISITDQSQKEVLKIYLNQLSIDENYNAIEEYNQETELLFDVKVIRMSDNNSNPCGVLLLKISKSNSRHLSTIEIESIKHALAGILSSIQQADMSKRSALHEERSLIARELHDSLAQSLSYLKIQVSRLQSLIKPDSSIEDIDLTAVSGIAEELRTNLNISYKQLRELITTFRLTLNSENLAQALEDSVEEFENKCSISFNLDNRLSLIDLAVDEEIQVLQIVREAVSNIVRHSQATLAEITLRKNSKNKICITIDDDGIGMDEAQTNKRRHGMIIMQQRAHDLGGTLRVLPSSLGGSQIKVTFITKNKRET